MGITRPTEHVGVRSWFLVSSRSRPRMALSKQVVMGFGSVGLLEVGRVEGVSTTTR